MALVNQTVQTEPENAVALNALAYFLATTDAPSFAMHGERSR